jgi:hypothetical protein
MVDTVSTTWLCASRRGRGSPPFRIITVSTTKKNNSKYNKECMLFQLSKVYMRTFDHWWCALRENANAIASVYTSFRQPSQPQKCHCIAATSVNEPNDFIIPVTSNYETARVFQFIFIDWSLCYICSLYERHWQKNTSLYGRPQHDGWD